MTWLILRKKNRNKIECLSFDKTEISEKMK